MPYDKRRVDPLEQQARQHEYRIKILKQYADNPQLLNMYRAMQFQSGKSPFRSFDMLEPLDPKKAIAYHRQQAAELRGQPTMGAYRPTKEQPTVAQKFNERAKKLYRAVTNPTAENNILSPVINPVVDYAFGQTKAGIAADKVQKGIPVTPQDEAAMRNAANMSTGKAFKTLVEGTPVFRQSARFGKWWAQKAGHVNGSDDALWALQTGATMNDKGRRYLTRFKANPWVASFIDLDPTEMFGNYVGGQVHNYLVASQYQRQMRAAAEQTDPKKRYQMQLKAMNNNFWRLYFMPDQYSAYGPSFFKYPVETFKLATEPNSHTQQPYPTYFWHFNTMVPTPGDIAAFRENSQMLDNLDQTLADQRKRQKQRGVTETNVYETPPYRVNKARWTLNLSGGKPITKDILPVVTQEQIDPVLSGYRQVYTKINDLMKEYNTALIADGTQPIAQIMVSRFPKGTPSQLWNTNLYSAYIAYTGAALQKLKDKLNSGQLTAAEQSKLRSQIAKLQLEYKELSQKTKGQVEARNTIARLMPGYLLDPIPSERRGGQYSHMPTQSIQNIARLLQWWLNPAYDKNREDQFRNMADKGDWIIEALPEPVLRK